MPFIGNSRFDDHVEKESVMTHIYHERHNPEALNYFCFQIFFI